MQKFIARIMAISLLLSVFGQVTAQPCADMHTQAGGDTHAALSQAMSHTTHDADGSGDMSMSGEHCGDMPSAMPESSGAHCADMSDAASDDCGQTCTCCPGHCANVLPSAESTGVAPPRSAHRADYVDLASTPEPESTIKPPRSA